MKTLIRKTLFLAISLLCLFSCNDTIKYEPIDTTQIKVTADVSKDPSLTWFTKADVLNINVNNVKIEAPKGVLIETITLLINNTPVMQKPYSGDNVTFQLPLTNINNANNQIAIWCTLVKKECRDAEYIIEDNINLTVFTEAPKFEKKATIEFIVSATSTSGEKYNHTYTSSSKDNLLKVTIPSEELYWTPTTGTAETINVQMKGSMVLNPLNSKLNVKISNSYWNGYAGDETLSITIPNKKGALNDKKLSYIANTLIWGTYEDYKMEQTMFYLIDVKEE